MLSMSFGACCRAYDTKYKSLTTLLKGNPNQDQDAIVSAQRIYRCNQHSLHLNDLTFVSSFVLQVQRSSKMANSDKFALQIRMLLRLLQLPLLLLLQKLEMST